MLYSLLIVLHLIICLVLILVVLLQSGKGGGLAGAFGGGMGGAGQSLFGGRGAATFLSKATPVFGIAFMVSSLVIALLSGGQSEVRSVLRSGDALPGVAPPPVSSQPVQIPSNTLPPVAPTQGTESATPDAAPSDGAPSTSDDNDGGGTP